MKKYFFLFCFLSLFLLSSVLAQNSQITGNAVLTNNSVTGKAVMQFTTVSAYVLVPDPTAILLKPKNLSYFNNKSMVLEFTPANYTNIWFNIDNGANNSLSQNITYFNVSQGSHILKLFINNTDNLIVQRNVTFFVNNNLFSVNYSQFELDSEQTRFNEYSYEELQNLSNITIFKSNKGKIVFPGQINLTSNGNSINIHSNVNISQNRIEINSSVLSMFNTSATLFLYNLTFTDPRILRDGNLCSDCVVESYSSGNLKFNVTGFSVYTAEETPESEGTTGGSGGSSGGGSGGGGGGGAAISQKIEFLSSIDDLHVSLKGGETKHISFTIQNKMNYPLQINLDSLGISEFVKFDVNNFNLLPGEKKIINLDIIAREDTSSDLYLGKIIIKSNSYIKELIVAIDVSSKSALFDVKLDIPASYKQIKPGEGLNAIVKIYNVGQSNRADAEVIYSIRDQNGNEILKETEFVAVETQVSFIKEFNLPKESYPGKYIIYVTVNYVGLVASSSSIFQVIGENEIDQYNLLLNITLIIAGLSLVILIVSYIIERNKQKLEEELILGKKISNRKRFKK